MGLGWRTAFCTSTPKDRTLGSPIINEKPETNPSPSPKLSNRFIGFFSQPSTPRIHREIPSIQCRTVATTNSAPTSPRLHCKIKNSPKLFNRSSTTPSSPRSPSTFPLLSKSKCGICTESVKTGQGTAIFTAECGHSFHFPCVAAHIKKECALTCPMCSSTWKEMHMLDTNNFPKINHQNHNSKLKIYNDDEPLSSPTCGARFNPIFESDESIEDENNEFPGFLTSKPEEKTSTGNLEIGLLPETAIVSVGKTTETHAVVLKIRAPPATLRKTPIDLVTVLNVSRSITQEKMQLMKKTMRLVVSSLSATDRLSIVAYSSTSKRLLPLRRMNSSGKRAARRIIDAVVALDAPVASIVADSLKKAAKVIEDRREINPTASILLFSDGARNSPVVSSTRFSTTDIQIHSISLSAGVHVEGSDSSAKRVCNLLSVVSQDVRIRLGFKSGSAPGEISASYSYAGRPELLGSGSNWCRVGDLYSQEERELLIELKVPSSFVRAHTLLSVGYSYKDPSTQRTIHEKELTRSAPHLRAIATCTREVQHLRCLFVSTRAVAESRRLLERGDVAGAHRMLASARALVLQSGTGVGAEFIRGLDAELAGVDLKGSELAREQRRREVNEVEKAEPLTPTSAWRAAERLAKVAIMRKSLNRVSDLHGFEDARF